MAIVDANGNVGIATSGTQYFTFQTGTPALDVALYTANPSPMYYFVEKNAPSTNFLQIYPSYNTVFNSGGSSVTNAAYVATNKNGNVAYVDTSGGLHYSAGAFGTAQSFTTVLASGVIRVSLSTTRLWYIDSSNDVWYVLLANLPGLPGSLVKTNGSQSTEISTGDGTVGGGIEATAVCTNSVYSYNIFVYNKGSPMGSADGSFPPPTSHVTTPNGALDIGVYSSNSGVYIDHSTDDVVYTSSF